MNLAHDDDGIIDLRALKSTPPPRGAFAAFPMSSPFGSEAPPGAFARDAGADSGVADVPPPRTSKAKTIGLAAGAALFVVLASVGIGFAFRGETPVKIASASVTPPAPPPASVAPPAPAAAADPMSGTSAPSAASSADDTSAAIDGSSAKKAKGAKGHAGVGKAKRSSAVASSPAPSPAPVLAKAADPCHCHGDFQCNIRCSANR